MECVHNYKSEIVSTFGYYYYYYYLSALLKMLLFILLFVVYAFALPFVESNRGPNTVKLWRIKLLWILLVERCVFYPIQEIICLKDIKQEAAFKFNLVCNIRSFLHAREV